MTGPLMGEGRPYCCEVCNVPGAWRLERRGDVATLWACDQDLAAVATWLQRDFEVTELTVTSAPKAREWAQINWSLRQIAEDPASYAGPGADSSADSSADSRADSRVESGDEENR